jgi:hypothetical protein
MFKQTLKKLVGKSNFDRASLIKKYLSVYSFRAVRFCKSALNRKEAGSYKIQKFSTTQGQTFFGYYDVTPFSKNNNMILAMVGPHQNRPPLNGEELLVGYFYRDSTGHFQPVDKTSTWCWQMGCRLQWFPIDENNLIIYNKMRSFNKAVV